jgi:hypothetical protein
VPAFCRRIRYRKASGKLTLQSVEWRFIARILGDIAVRR